MNYNDSNSVMLINSNQPNRSGRVIANVNPLGTRLVLGGYGIMSTGVTGLNTRFAHRFDDYRDNFPVPGSSGDVSMASSGNQAQTITYAASTYGAHTLGGVAWSYSSTPNIGVGADLTIKDGNTVIFRHLITSAGPDDVVFNPPKRGSSNTAMTIILDAGGTIASGDLSILSHWLS